MRTAKRRFHCLLWSLVGWIGTAALLSAGAVEPPAAPQAGGSGPAITVLEPDEGPVGTEVVIRGENFGASIGVLQGTSGVSFGGVWASPSTWSEGEVRVEVPAGATTGPVVVTVSGVGSEGLAFTVTGAGTTGPAVGTVSPAQGAAGTEVVIRGTDFGPPEGAEQGTAGVSFNGVAGTPASWSEGEIRVAVPEGATAGPVVVTVGGEASNGVGFTVTAAGIARPSIVSVSPELATAGTEVVIRGENFGDPEGAAQGARGVSFNGVWAEPSFWSEGEIRVAVPEGAPGGQVVVVVDGEGSDGAGFTVTGPAPVIETVDPTHGPEGTGVVIRGEHFGSAIAAVQGTAGVSFGGVWAEASFWSGTEIRAAVPEGGESGQVAVTAGGQESNGVDFTVPAGGKGSAWAGAAHASSVGKGEPVGPEITSVTPDSGPVGTSVTVAGTGFGAAQGTSTVSFNGAAGVPTSWSETEIRVPVPAGAATCAPEGTVLTVEVTVGGQKSNGGEFLLDPPVIIEVSDNVVSEPDGEATITVRRDPFQYQTAAYGYRGTAKRGIGKDYVVDRLVFPPGANTATTTLRVLDDQVYEGDETIEIVATVRDLGGKECEISEEILLKDDELPPLAISVITHQHGGLEVSHLREGEPAYRTFAVTVSVPEGEAPATDTTITLVSGGTASSETDYTLAETVTLGVGKRSVETPLTVIDDDPFEIPETLTLQATDGRNDGYQASPVVTVWIYDDNYSTLTVSAEAATVSEPNGTVRVTASVEEGKELATDATVVLGPIGTATHKVDYSLQKRLTLPANQSSVSTVLSVIDDAALEGEETIHLAASGDGTSALGHSQTMTIRLEDDEVPPLTLTADRTSVSEPGGTAQVTVSVPAGGEPSVDTTISIWDIGYARLGEDFTVETLTIPQGGTSGTATLTVIDDDLYEDTEEIRIQASKTGYKISPVLKIQLEDNEQKLRLAVSPGQVSEPSGTAQVTVSVAKAIEADAVVTLHRNGTAASGSDYTLAQTATISAGETSAPATTLQVVDNTIYEGAKTIELQARATGYGDSDPVKVDLADDELPPLTLTVDTASVGEVDGQRRATLTVTVPESAKPAGDLTVTLLHTGAATVATGDYAVETLTIPQEGTSGTATLTVVDDGEYEGDETIVLQATAPDYRASGEVTVTVEDDDPTITGFTPKRGAPDVVVTISGDNFTEQGTTVQFNGVEVEASKVKFVSATEIQATVPPAAATGAITVKTPGGTVTSTDSFTVLRLHIQVDPATVEEKAGKRTAMVTVSVDDPVEGNLPVIFTFQGTADRGRFEDYTMDQTVTITAGNTSAEKTLTVRDDRDYEEEETITIQAGAEGYQSSEVATVALISDDLPELDMSCPLSLQESHGTEQITVYLPFARDADTLVSFAFKGTATRGTDYAMDQMVTIDEGNISAEKTLTVIDDRRHEGDETIDLEASADGYQTAFCVFSIEADANDPVVPPLTLSVSSASLGEASGKRTATVTVSVDDAVEADDGLPVTFTFGGTADRETDPDYTMDQTVTILNTKTSASTTLTVIDDAVAESDETITITAGATDYSDSEAVTVTIADDDVPGVTVSEASLSITEGKSGTYQVKLDTQPTADVTITVASSDEGAVTVTPASLTFTAGNWNTARAVTVEAVHDEDIADETATLTHVAAGGDTNYAGIAIDSVSVSVTDDEVPGVTVTPTRLSITEGSSKSYRVKLKTRPSASVTVSMSSSNGDVGVPSTPLAFTTETGATGGWDQFQSVSVRIAHDDNTTDESGTITHTAASNDSDYDGISVPSVSVSVSDDDPENQQPVVERQIPDMTLEVDEERTINLSPHFSDPDGDNLTYWASSSDTSTVTESVNNATNILTIRGVAVTASSSPTVTVTASDGSLSVSQAFSVTVVQPALSCSVSPAIVSERAGKRTSTIRVTVPAGAELPSSVALGHPRGGTAISDDYTIGALTKRSNAWEATLTVVDDSIVEGNETVLLQASATDYDPSPERKVTIEDDDQPQLGLSVSPAIVSERAGKRTSTIRVTVPAGAELPSSVALGHPRGGTAISDDYTIGALTKRSNAWEATLTVVDDSIVEGNETVLLQASATDYDPSPERKVTIEDDDQPQLGLSVSPAIVSERAGKRTSTIRVTVPAGAELPSSVALGHPRGGTAISDDYTIGALTKRSNAWEATLTVVDDSIVEGNETVLLQASATDYDPSPERKVTIEDDDQPQLGLSVSPAIVSERAGKRTSTIRVTVPAGAELPSSVALGHPRGGTAISDDYTIGALTKRSNAWEATLTVVDDSIVEGNETVLLQASATDYDPSPERKVTIEDDDQPQLGLSVSPAIVSERAGKRTSTIRVTVPAGAELPSSVALGHPRGGTAISDDYTIGALTKRSNAWEATLTVVDDSIVEGNETVLLQASATDYDPSPERKVTIEDDDQPPKPVITSINPALQWLNYPVTIYGNHFGSTPGSVSFGGYTVGSQGQFQAGSNSGYSWSNASISLLIPGSIYPGHVSVTVTTHNGMTSSPYFYTVTDNPVQRGECDDEEDCPEEKEKEESEGSGETEEDQAEGGG